MKRPDMPMLAAFRRGEMSAQDAINNRARYLDEAEAIIAEVRGRREDADVLEGLGESYAA